jgi:hypothetical protein
MKTAKIPFKNEKLGSTAGGNIPFNISMKAQSYSNSQFPQPDGSAKN